jgi:hypothetical protein
MVASSTYLPSTRQRVRRNTDASINRRIDDQLEHAIRYYSVHLEDIDSRPKELDEEWDVERMIEANASTLGLAGTILGITVDKRFLALPMIVTAFLLQHAIQGWCPPIPILRRLGFRLRTRSTVSGTRSKRLRGDFASVGDGTTLVTIAGSALKAVRR